MFRALAFWQARRMRARVVGPIVVLLAGPAAAEAVDGFQVQGWSGAGFVDGSRRFTHCIVSAAFGASSLTMALDRNYEFRIEVASDDWKLRAGNDYVATLK